MRQCRICGCTDFSACQTVAGPCYWVEEDLCSACVELETAEEEDPPAGYVALQSGLVVPEKYAA